MKKHSQIGKAWIVYSKDITNNNTELVSILNPRKTAQNIADYVEHLYVDRFASIQEKISYKKKSSRWLYPAEIGFPSNVVSCGFGSIYLAYYCHNIELKKNELIGHYKFIKTVDSDHKPIEFTEGKIILHNIDI